MFFFNVFKLCYIKDIAMVKIKIKERIRRKWLYLVFLFCYSIPYNTNSFISFNCSAGMANISIRAGKNTTQTKSSWWGQRLST